MVYEEHGEQSKEKGVREDVRKAGVRAGYDVESVIYEDRTSKSGLCGGGGGVKDMCRETPRYRV